MIFSSLYYRKLFLSNMINKYVKKLIKVKIMKKNLHLIKLNQQITFVKHIKKFNQILWDLHLGFSSLTFLNYIFNTSNILIL